VRYLSARTAWETLISAVVAFAVSLIVFGPILGLLNSGWAGGDMVSTYVNAEAWSGFSYETTTQFGFPLGMNLNYFPGIDITENVFAQLVTNLTGQPFIGINLLVLISFPLVAALMYLVIRMTGLRGALAIALAVTASLIPFHWGRALGHTYLSTLYSAAIGLALVMLIGSGQFERLRKLGNKRQKFIFYFVIALMVVIISWTGVYYVAFTLLLGAAALIWRLAHRARIKELVIEAVPFIGIGAVAAVGFIPALLTLRADPPLLSLGERLPYESVIFAGNLAVALLPIPLSTLPGMGAYNAKIVEAISAAPWGESTAITNHGTWITSLALVVMLVGIVLATRRSSKPTQRKAKKVPGAPVTLSFITYLTIVVLLFFVPWGLNYLFAGAVTPQIRAWNRLVPILLWLFLLGAAVVIQRTRIARRLVYALPIALIVLGLTALDSTLPYRQAYGDSTTRSGELTSAARDYSKTVNTAIPNSCGILQLPYMAYPEFGAVQGVNDYDHFWTSLLNPNKSWSYGAVKNTDASIWASQLPEIPNPEQVEQLRQGGFCAIHFDTRGLISEQLPPLEQYLAENFGAPIATGYGGKWQLYAIANPILTTGEGNQTGVPATLPAFFNQPMITADPITVAPRGTHLDFTWWWTIDPIATFTITPITSKVPVTTVSGAIRSPACGTRPVTVKLQSAGQEQVATVIAKDKKNTEFTLTLPTPSTTPVTLVVEAPGEGCSVAGFGGQQFAQVIDLAAS
jgi:hypothetical protein